jgi:hypothetical protein
LINRDLRYNFSNPGTLLRAISLASWMFGDVMERALEGASLSQGDFLRSREDGKGKA